MTKLITRNESTLQEKHFNAVILRGWGGGGGVGDFTGELKSEVPYKKCVMWSSCNGNNFSNGSKEEGLLFKIH